MSDFFLTISEKALTNKGICFIVKDVKNINGVKL